MKSATLPSFWEAYGNLDEIAHKQARKAYRLWRENPFHPSLHFKCINHAEDIWAVRININLRAVGVLDGDTVTWFWIGKHDKYEEFFS